MTKRFFMLLCCMLLALGIPCGAQGEARDAALDLSALRPYETVRSLCWIGDTLYMLGNGGVYSWAWLDEKPALFLDLSDAEDYQFVQLPPLDGAERKNWDKAVRFLLTDGEALYGLHPFSGQISVIGADGLRPVAALPQEALWIQGEEDALCREVKDAAWQGGRFFVLLGPEDPSDTERTQLISMALAGGGVSEHALEGVAAIAAGDADTLLLYRTGEHAGIWTYAPTTDALEKRLSAPDTDEGVSGMAWYGAQRAVACCVGTQLGLTGAPEETQVKTYLPIHYSGIETEAACSQSGLYAYPIGNYMFIRDIADEKGDRKTVLRIAGSVMPDLLVRFTVENPDIAVDASWGEVNAQILQAAITGDRETDLFVVSAPGNLSDLKQKGYAAALNADAQLVAAARQMYPTIQEAIFEGEDLIAYPIALTPQAWTVNETRWERYGLPNYPGTYGELLDQIDLWLRDYAQEYPEDTLSGFQQSGLLSLIQEIVKAYIFESEASGKPLSFDTPAFRAVMQDVAERATLLGEEHEQWGMPLMDCYYQGFGLSYNDSDRILMLTPPAIEETEEPMLMATLEALMVNAASEKQAEARRFIAFCAEHLREDVRYAMQPGLTQPVYRANYEERVAELEAERIALEGQLESARDESEADAIEEKIARTQRMLEDNRADPWSISPEGIQVYREAAQNLRIPFDSAFLGQGENGSLAALMDVVQRYTQDGLEMPELDAMIAELDRVAGMVYRESM